MNTPILDGPNPFTNLMNARLLADEIAFTIKLASRVPLEDEAKKLDEAAVLYAQLAPFFAVRALSTHTAAGAGPVSEAVAFEFDRYIDGTLMAEGVKIERQPTLEKAAMRAAQIASHGLNSEVPVLVLRSSATARTVEEPGEVERGSDEESYQIGKRDGYEDAAQHIDERTGGDGEYVAVVGYDGDDRNCPDAPSMVAKIVRRFEATELRAETAEAALAAMTLRAEAAEARLVAGESK